MDIMMTEASSSSGWPWCSGSSCMRPGNGATTLRGGCLLLLLLGLLRGISPSAVPSWVPVVTA